MPQISNTQNNTHHFRTIFRQGKNFVNVHRKKGELTLHCIQHFRKNLIRHTLVPYECHRFLVIAVHCFS